VDVRIEYNVSFKPNSVAKNEGKIFIDGKLKEDNTQNKKPSKREDLPPQVIVCQAFGNNSIAYVPPRSTVNIS